MEEKECNQFIYGGKHGGKHQFLIELIISNRFSFRFRRFASLSSSLGSTGKFGEFASKIFLLFENMLVSSRELRAGTPLRVRTFNVCSTAAASFSEKIATKDASFSNRKMNEDFQIEGWEIEAFRIEAGQIGSFQIEAFQIEAA